ncbi:hypothetical protein [Lysinibacillus sp. NPDC047702]|uniref:hypothetical protein n=1 Tax=unclassified Lysinibacillus TaxID=2636778 RepID=UPI003D05D6A7
MLTLVIILFVVVLIFMFLFALIKVGMSKSSECHKCRKKFKMLGNKVKCPFCNTKHYKQPDGSYTIEE